jgi:hypothetical protein
MNVSTAWAQDGEAAAAMTWRYPALAEAPFPSGAINAVLASIYNNPSEALDNPYLFIARDRYYDQIGLVITDPEGVELAQEDINALYALTMEGAAREKPWKVDAEWRCKTAANIEGDTAAVEWPFGYVFPVDPLNNIFAALYNAGARPFIYPAYDREDEESDLRLVGLLVCGLLDLPDDASGNWRAIRNRYRTILEDDALHPSDVPWGQKEWSLA